METAFDCSPLWGNIDWTTIWGLDEPAADSGQSAADSPE